MKSGPGQAEPQNGRSLMRISLKINGIWAWPAKALENGRSSMRIKLEINAIWAWLARAPKWSFFNKN